MSRRLGIAIVCFLAAIGHVSAAPLPASAFAYDASVPLDLRSFRAANVDGIRRDDVTFAVPNRGRVVAEIVAPLRPAPHHAGVLFVHWLGDDAATTNHTEFEADAVVLARAGVTSLLIDASWAQPKWFEHGRSPATDDRDAVTEVIALRRALDVLQAQPGVDATRLAYVGHDFGAMFGAVLSGVDPRPRWYVLMAGTTTFSQWFLLGEKPADIAAYIARMEPFDPGPYLARSHATAYFFEFAQNDAYITPPEAAAFFAAAPVPRTMAVYDVDHSLRITEATSDRRAWLLARLVRSDREPAGNDPTRRHHRALLMPAGSAAGSRVVP